MLSYLRIKDFALIESLELDLAPGLTVLTGETGAGKSIILAAVGLLLGRRADSDLIRENAETAVVEAVFEPNPGGPAAAALACEELLEPDQASPDMVVRRLVNMNGRNRVKANGSVVPLNTLSRLGPVLVNICGQHAHQLLLKAEEHLLLLDSFGGLDEKRAQVAEMVRRIRGLDREIARLKEAVADRLRRKDYLEHMVAELSDAGLSVEEETKLKSERRKLANVEKVAKLAEGAHLGLMAAENGSALEVLAKIRGLLKDLERLDPEAKQMTDVTNEAYFLLEDASHQVRDYLAGLTFDPARLDKIESRLMQIQHLSRKYGGDVTAAIEALKEAKEELESLDKGDKNLAALQDERRSVLAQTLKLAGDLSVKRKAAALALAEKVREELAQLGMDELRFEVRFLEPKGGALETSAGPLSADGLERGEFFIAPNPGEGFRPLVRIASGGELSRILLALEKLAAGKKGAETLVFDEVDAGIGGAVGSAVGRKLAQLSKSAQVICITHLPQIAAWADHHYLVEKKTQNGRTATSLSRLNAAERERELARMLAGEGGDETALKHARQLIGSAAEKKAATG